MNDVTVLAKRDAAVEWCAHATAENMTLVALANQYGVKGNR